MGLLEQRRAAFRAATAGAKKQPAASQSTNQNPDTPDIPGAQFDDPLRLVALEADISGLRAINSHVHRATVKRDKKIPAYVDYLKQHMAANKPASAVLVQVMIWAFDAEQFDYGFELANYAIVNNGKMPLNFQRDIPNFVLGQVADWAIAKTAIPESPEPVLSIAISWMDEHETFDIVDLIRALLLKARAAHLENSGDIEAALEFYEQAQALHDNARCKMQIKRLAKQISETKSNTEEATNG